MSKDRQVSIDEVLAQVDDLIAATDQELVRNAAPNASKLLAWGEAILIAWHEARGSEPTHERVEGFRLLALHRQGARGNPAFNACRETCREIVYHHNLILHDPRAAEIARTIRVGAMVVRHLALFVGGKLQEAGLGEFCCSSRPIRQGEQLSRTVETL